MKSAIAEQTALIEAPQTTALAPAPATPSGDAFMAMVERLAANPAVDVTKLAQIVDLQRGILADNAKAAFNAAFAQMQPEIPTIARSKRTNNAKYAPQEDIVQVVRPILERHGFGLSFRTEWPDKNTVRVVGILTHAEGHERTSEFLSEADDTGNKNDIQALGSAVTYGRRYTTTDLLNITTKDMDDNGAAAGRRTQSEVKAPAGFEDWWTDMIACADSGTKALEEAWTKSKPEYRKHVIASNKAVWEGLKRKAAGVRS